MWVITNSNFLITRTKAIRDKSMRRLGHMIHSTRIYYLCSFWDIHIKCIGLRIMWKSQGRSTTYRFLNVLKKYLSFSQSFLYWTWVALKRILLHFLIVPRSNVHVLVLLLDYFLLSKKYFEYLRAYYGVFNTSPSRVTTSYNRYTVKSLYFLFLILLVSLRVLLIRFNDNKPWLSY